MPVYYPKPLARLVNEFERLPGIGPKSAQRLAFHVMRLPSEQIRSFSEALLGIEDGIRFCTVCFSYTDGEVCDICKDPRRDLTQLCVVAEPRDLIAMEKTNEFRGGYHVLHGVISPLDGITPDKLKIKELVNRVSSAG